MGRKRFYASVCAAVLLAMGLMLSAAAAAPSVQEGMLSGTEDHSVFSAGQQAGSTAQVQGVLFAAGYQVQAGGSSQYTVAAGYNVLLDGTVEDDAFLAGNEIRVDGTVQRDLYAAGSQITVGGQIGRSLYAAGNRIVVTGTVSGDLYLNAETIIVEDGAAIGGTLQYNDDADIQAPENVLAAAQTYHDASALTPQEQAEKNRQSALLDFVLSFIGVVALAYVLLWLTPLWETVDSKYYGAPLGCYARAFGLGFAVLAGVPLVAILLLVTGAGLRLAVILLLLYVAMILASPIFLGFFLGALLWRRVLKKAPCYWAELPIGLLLWKGASCIPVLSFAVGLITVPLGLGVGVLLLGKHRAAVLPAKEKNAVPVAFYGPDEEEQER